MIRVALLLLLSWPACCVFGALTELQTVDSGISGNSAWVVSAGTAVEQLRTDNGFLSVSGVGGAGQFFVVNGKSRWQIATCTALEQSGWSAFGVTYYDASYNEIGAQQKRIIGDVERRYAIGLAVPQNAAFAYLWVWNNDGQGFVQLDDFRVENYFPENHASYDASQSPGNQYTQTFPNGRNLILNGCFETFEFEGDEFWNVEPGYGTADPPMGGSTTVVVNAFGSEGGEQFVLRAGGQTFAPVEVTTTNTGYSFQVNGPVSLDSVRIDFVNDFYDPGVPFDDSDNIDFNLTVDNIVIDGIVHETESPDTFSIGDFRGGEIVSGLLQIETLLTTGYFQFGAEIPDGAEYVLDTTFEFGGLAYEGAGGSILEFARSESGQVAVVELSSLPLDDPFTTRFEPFFIFKADGTLDTSYGGGDGALAAEAAFATATGRTLGQFQQIRIQHLAIDSQGRVLVAALVFPEQGDEFNSVIRLNVDGTLDTSFALNGAVLGIEIEDIATGPNDEVFIAGKDPGPQFFDPVYSVFLGYDASGQEIVNTFFNTGYVTNDINLLDIDILDVRDDGSVVVHNETYNQSTGLTVPQLRHYDSSGALVSGFGNGGIVALQEIVFNALSDSQGRLIIETFGGEITRYLANGQLDTSFGDGGTFDPPQVVVVDGEDFGFDARSLIVDAQDRIIGLGSVSGGSIIFRLTESGEVDTSLAGIGAQRVPAGSTVRYLAAGENGTLLGFNPGFQTRLVEDATLTPSTPSTNEPTDAAANSTSGGYGARASRPSDLPYYGFGVGNINVEASVYQDLRDLEADRNYTLTINGGLEASNELVAVIGIDFLDANGNEVGEVSELVTATWEPGVNLGLPGQQSRSFSTPANFDRAVLWIWVPNSNSLDKLWLTKLSIQ